MARLSFLALLGLALAGVAAAGPTDQDARLTTQSDKWTWATCGKISDPVQIKDIQVSPDPPVPGQDLTVTVVGEAREIIEDGAYADVVVKVGVIKLLQKEFDLCEEARNADLDVQCPIQKGIYTITHTVALPKEIPPAPFKVHVDGYTVEDENLVCLDIQIDFRKPHSFW